MYFGNFAKFIVEGRFGDFAEVWEDSGNLSEKPPKQITMKRRNILLGLILTPFSLLLSKKGIAKSIEPAPLTNSGYDRLVPPAKFDETKRRLMLTLPKVRLDEEGNCINIDFIMIISPWVELTAFPILERTAYALLDSNIVRVKEVRFLKGSKISFEKTI